MSITDKFKDYQTEAAVSAALAQPVVEKINGRHFVIAGGEIPYHLEKADMPPPYVQQTVQTGSLDALRKFLDFHRSADGEDKVITLFADKGRGRFTLVFDYHLSCLTPAHAKNRAIHDLEHDPRFTAWQRVLNLWLTQEQFIDLLETEERSLHSPPAGEMLSLAQNLEIHTSSKVVARKSLRNGTGAIVFEDTEGEHSTKVPEILTVGVPVYRGLRDDGGRPKAWLIRLRLRYRVKDGGVTFCLVPVGLDDTLDQIWSELVAEVATWGPPVIEAVAP